MRGPTGETLIAGIGQGAVLATPLQLATMAARLVTGRAVVPRLVRDGKLPPGGDETLPAFASLGVNPGHRALVLDGMNAVVNEQRGTAYAARITDPAYAMGGKSGTSQVRQITQWERDHGVRKASQVPWRERDHALFVAFAPVQTPRYVCATVVEHGGADAGGGSAVAAPICRDVLLEAQRRDPARRVPEPEAMAESMVDRRAGGIGHFGRRQGGMTDFGIGRRELTLADKFRGIQWGLLLLLGLIAAIGFAMLYSAANGEFQPWASRQMIRFGVVLIAVLAVALIDVAYWFRAAYWIYAAALLLVVAVDLRGIVGMGAQRWICDRLVSAAALRSDEDRAGAGAGAVFPSSAAGKCRPDPLSAGSGADDRAAGAAGAEAARSRHRDDAAGGRRGAVVSRRRAGLDVRGRRRRERLRPRRWPGRCCAAIRRAGFYTFLDPERDPLGAGYHILQSKIALGSGGLFGKGFLQGTQSHLSFLPEKQTDFIFTMIAEEFGLIGGVVLLALYLAVIVYAFAIALRSRSRFGRLLGLGIATNFFLYAFINTAMVTGLIPVVGVPLPLISYGGTAMIAVLIGFGMVMNVGIHRDVRISRYGESRLD